VPTESGGAEAPRVIPGWRALFEVGSRRGLACWTVAIAALFVLLQIPGFSTAQVYPDSTEFAQVTMRMLGHSPQRARDEVVRFWCEADVRAERHSLWLEPAVQSGSIKAGVSPSAVAGCERAQYVKLTPGQKPIGGPSIGVLRDGRPFIDSADAESIFLARPGYPALIAPFVAVFGLSVGMWLGTVLLCAAGGVLTVLVLRASGLSPPFALFGQMLFYALPTGTFGLDMLAEGTELDCVLVVLLGLCLLWRYHGAPGGALGWRAWLPWVLLLGGFGLGFAVKYSQFVLLAILLAPACLIAAWRGRWSGRVGLSAAAVCAVAAGGMLLGAHLAGWPSLSVTMQDLFAANFTGRPVAHPLRYLPRAEYRYWTQWLRQAAAQLSDTLLWIVGIVAAWRYRAPFGWLLIATGASGLANAAAHPQWETARLYVVLWLVAVCGVPLAASALLDAVRRRQPRPASLATSAADSDTAAAGRR
jgi:hypothetical protein